MLYDAQNTLGNTKVMKPTHFFSIIVAWYLILGSPSVCLGSTDGEMFPEQTTEHSPQLMLRLIQEIEQENIKNIRKILTSSKQLINQLDGSGKSPLMHAIKLRKTKVVKHLITEFSDHINFRLTDLRNHATALDYANFVETKHIYNLLIPFY